MSAPGGKRRDLLANAIDSIGAKPPLALPAGGGDGQMQTDELLSSANFREEPTGPMFLERRGVAFDEIVRTVKRPTIRLKPSECSIWPGNARTVAHLTQERCESLISSIQEEGGNREAVVVRRTPHAEQPYELIVGTRRHFSVAWLHANNHSEIELIARIETLDDEAAFRLADLENREREDVTDLERARNYQHAIEAYYNGARIQMSERLAIPRQNLHNLLQLAELPNDVVCAFAEPGDLKVRHGMRLSPLIKDPVCRDSMLQAALVLADEQASLKQRGMAKIEGSKICEALTSAAMEAKANVSVKPLSKAKLVPTLMSASGTELGLIIRDDKKKGLTININPKAGVTTDEILEALRSTVDHAKCMRT
jgi:ParB family chromosome partitioning protein